MMEANQIIAEVAKTTGVRLDRSDPILAAAVVHEALLNEALVKLDRQVTIQANRVTAASTQAIVDAKREAELLLTDAAGWVDERMKAAGQSAAMLMLAELRQETQVLQQATSTMMRAVWLMSFLMLVTTCGLLGIVLAGLK